MITVLIKLFYTFFFEVYKLSIFIILFLCYVILLLIHRNSSTNIIYYILFSFARFTPLRKYKTLTLEKGDETSLLSF